MSRHLKDLKTLLDLATYVDDYGVYGSSFECCRICGYESGAGALALSDWHEAGCPVPRLQRKYEQRGANKETP